MEASVDSVRVGHRRKLWFDVADPSVEDMEALAEAMGVPREALLGKLSSNYPHVDSYPEYTKVFTWYLNTSGTGRDLTAEMGPVIAFTNGHSVVTISKTWTGTSEAVANAFESPRYGEISLTARVIYLTLSHVMDSYEHFVDRYEAETERFEREPLPWLRGAYIEAFELRREASSLLRLLRHLRRLAEALVDEHTEIGIGEAEKRLFDGILERAVGAEETTDLTRETVLDLLGMHMDTLSYDMNRTMRLIAALAVIIGVPAVISTLLGASMPSVGGRVFPWVEIGLSLAVMAALAAAFYVRGWMRAAE